MDDAIRYATDFWIKLQQRGRWARERKEMRDQIKVIATSRGLDEWLGFALDCVQSMARHTEERCRERVVSWDDAGFK